MGMLRAPQDSISSALVRALQTCPDSVPMRRELLIATRHVLTTAVRTGQPPPLGGTPAATCAACAQPDLLLSHARHAPPPHAHHDHWEALV